MIRGRGTGRSEILPMLDLVLVGVLARRLR
jgi:hypothetical protein